MPWLVVILGYLLGSIPTGYIAGRIFKKVDIRRVGDGNMGAQNVFRQLGAKTGVAVGLIDAGKGALAILIVVGLTVGLAIGLLLGWVVWPVQYYDTDIADLQVVYKEQYIVLVGEAYTLDRDLEKAQARLEELESPNTSQWIGQLADRYIAEGRAQREIQALVELAHALGVDTPQMVAFLASPTPVPTDTPLPTPTHTATLIPTPTSIPPTETPIPPSPTPQPSATPQPSNTLEPAASDTPVPPTAPPEPTAPPVVSAVPVPPDSSLEDSSLPHETNPSDSVAVQMAIERCSVLIFLSS